jgi:hypothetical protein
MTGLYLYAITDDVQSEVPVVEGPGGVSLYGLAYRDIAAWVSPVPSTRVAVSAECLWQHEAVIEALMSRMTVLPARFGTIFPSEDAAMARLEENYGDLRASLQRVRGRVELGLRVIWDASDGSKREKEDESVRSTPKDGRSYLSARLEEIRQDRARQKQAEALAMEIHAPLARLADENTYRLLSTPRQLLTASYLVRRNQVAAFEQQVEDLIARHPPLHILCTGPWPVYSFVTAGTGRAERQERHDAII